MSDAPKPPPEPKPREKIIVRRLPPTLPEQVFMDSVSKWKEHFRFIQFTPGKLAKSSTKENVFSRAVIVFKTVPGLLEFHKGFSGHVFIDGKGNKYRAAVEFAPFQRWVDPENSKKKQDHRMGTIENDSTYLAFLEELKEPKKEEVDKGDIEYMLSKKEEQPKITPLLQAIRVEREKRALKKQIKKAKNASGSGRGMRSNDGSQSQSTKPTESSGGGSSKRKKKKKGNSGEGRDSSTTNREPSNSGPGGSRSNLNDSRDLPPSPSKAPKKFTLTKKDGSTKTF